MEMILIIVVLLWEDYQAFAERRPKREHTISHHGVGWL